MIRQQGQQYQPGLLKQMEEVQFHVFSYNVALFAGFKYKKAIKHPST